MGCLLEGLETVVLTLIIFLLIQTFVAQPYEVEQQSMETTLEPGQYVLVDKLTPRFSDYKRGDIIVFHAPASADPTGTQNFIKRVIGVGGETVEIHDGHVFVNGTQINEPYLDEGVLTTAPTGAGKWTLQKDQLFVLGDNRENSRDSRSFGPISTSSVLGRAWLRYWPVPSFGPLSGASYPELSPPPGPSGSQPPGTPSPTPSAAG